MDKKYFTFENGIRNEIQFSDNQYEAYNGGVFLYKEQVNARYVNQDEPMYKENMLIEALPPVYSIDQIVEKLQTMPIYSEIEREKSKEYRIQAITRLQDFVSVLENHIRIMERLSVAIRRGYTSKRIGTPEFIRSVNFTSELIHDKWTKDKLNKLKCFFNNNSTASPGFAVIGISGGGKSTALNKLLTLYPQCIVHTHYDDDVFLFKQIVWLKIDCSHNGSIKGLCMKFFKEIDEILGSDYSKTFGNSRNNTDSMIAAMAHITQIHALGILVIDEIQHLANMKEGPEKVLNFLVTLENEIRIPIVFIGTYKAYDKVLGRDFRQARRASGMGEIEWKHMSEDCEWDNFMEEMWRFQWTKYKSFLTDDIKRTFYASTMGITERIVSLYMAVQIEAILTGEDAITPELVAKVASDHMPLTAKMIRALRSGNLSELERYDDIRPISLSSFAEGAIDRIEHEKQLREVKENNKRKTLNRRSEIIDSIVITLGPLGFNERESKSTAIAIIEEHGLNKNLDFYLQQVGKLIKESGKDSEKIESNKSKVKKNESIDFYSQLKIEGKVKDPEEDFPQI